MTLAQLIPLAVMVSMAGILLSVALQAELRDLTYLLRHRSLLLRTVLAMNIVMPLLAITMGLVLDLEPPIELALVAMALAPVPPILPGTELKAGGNRRYTMGLMVISCVLSIAFVPAVVAWLSGLAHHPIRVTPAQVAKIVAVWMLLPILIGAVVRALSAKAADAAAPWVGRAAVVLLLLASVPILLKEWRYMLELCGNFSIIAIAGFALAGLAIGHLLGGPEPRTRTVLGLATSLRHPGVAMAILQLDQDPHMLLASVLMVLLVSAAVAQVYARWRARVAPRPVA